MNLETISVSLKRKRNGLYVLGSIEINPQPILGTQRINTTISQARNVLNHELANLRKKHDCTIHAYEIIDAHKFGSLAQITFQPLLVDQNDLEKIASYLSKQKS